MKNILLISTLSFYLSGCIFTPPKKSAVYVSSTTDTTNTTLSHSVWGAESAVTETDPLLQIAKKQRGVAYKYGGASPSGFDCSGFVSYVYSKMGVALPRTAKAQSTFGRILETPDLLPGDILFFETSDSGEINHSGIYLGNGEFIHASSGKGKVTISNMRYGFYAKAFRWGTRVEY